MLLDCVLIITDAVLHCQHGEDGCFAKLEWSLGEAGNDRRYMECRVFIANEVIGSNIVAKPGHGLITLQPNMSEGGKWS